MAVFCLAARPGRPAGRGSAGSIVARTPRRPRGDRARPEGRRRDGRAAARRAGAQPGADAGGLAGAGAWRPVRQHRAWLQLGDGDAARPEAGRRRGDRGRVRRRSGRREVPRHQVPRGRADAVLRGGGGDGARAEDAWRRGARPSSAARTSAAVRARRGQPGAPRREHARVRPAGGGRRSTTSPPTPRPSSPWCATRWRRWASRPCSAPTGPTAPRARPTSRAAVQRLIAAGSRRDSRRSIPTRCRWPTRSAPSRAHLPRRRHRHRPPPPRKRLAAFEAPGFGASAGLHRQDAVQLHRRPDAAGRARGPRAAGARGAAVGRRRLRRGDLRRHHDHARPAARAGGGGDPAGCGREIEGLF